MPINNTYIHYIHVRLLNYTFKFCFLNIQVKMFAKYIPKFTP